MPTSAMRLDSSSGVTPYRLAASTLAPAATSAWAISTSELWAAQSRGVEPSPEGALTSDRDLTSVRTALRSRDLTAFASGLSPPAPSMVADRATITRHTRTKRAIRSTPAPASESRHSRYGTRVLSQEMIARDRPAELRIRRAPDAALQPG